MIDLIDGLNQSCVTIFASNFWQNGSPELKQTFLKMKQPIHINSSPPAPTSRVVLKAISPNSKRKQPGISGLKKRNVVILSSSSDDSLENLPVNTVSLNVFSVI